MKTLKEFLNESSLINENVELEHARGECKTCDAEYAKIDKQKQSDLSKGEVLTYVWDGNHEVSFKPKKKSIRGKSPDPKKIETFTNAAAAQKFKDAYVAKYGHSYVPKHGLKSRAEGGSDY